MERDLRALVLACFGAAAAGCAAGPQATAREHGGFAAFPVATQAEVVRAVEERARLRGAFLLDDPSASYVGGYKARVAQQERGASLLLPASLDEQLDAVWRGHDPVAESVWIAVDGAAEAIPPHRSSGAGFDDFSPDLYGRAPSRDPWGRLVSARLVAWRYASKFRFVERAGGVGEEMRR